VANFGDEARWDIVISELNNGLQTWLEGLNYNVNSLGSWNSRQYPCIIAGDNIITQRALKQQLYLEVNANLHIFGKEVESIIDTIIGDLDSLTIENYDVLSNTVVNHNKLIEGQITHSILTLRILIV
jgi:hypothetical protein